MPSDSPATPIQMYTCNLSVFALPLEYGVGELSADLGNQLAAAFRRLGSPCRNSLSAHSQAQSPVAVAVSSRAMSRKLSVTGRISILSSRTNLYCLRGSPGLLHHPCFVCPSGVEICLASLLRATIGRRKAIICWARSVVASRGFVTGD